MYIPWDVLADSYNETLSLNQGRFARDVRLVIGAVNIKHKPGLSDEEAVAQIQENPYLQYFAGLPGYQTRAPFTSSLFVEIRKRMGQAIFDAFHDAIIEVLEEKKKPRDFSSKAEHTTKENDAPYPPESESTDYGRPDKQGKLIIDATVADQAI